MLPLRPHTNVHAYIHMHVHIHTYTYIHTRRDSAHADRPATVRPSSRKANPTEPLFTITTPSSASSNKEKEAPNTRESYRNSAGDRERATQRFESPVEQTRNPDRSHSRADLSDKPGAANEAAASGREQLISPLNIGCGRGQTSAQSGGQRAQSPDRPAHFHGEGGGVAVQSHRGLDGTMRPPSRITFRSIDRASVTDRHDEGWTRDGGAASVSVVCSSSNTNSRMAVDNASLHSDGGEGNSTQHLRAAAEFAISNHQCDVGPEREGSPVRNQVNPNQSAKTDTARDDTERKPSSSNISVYVNGRSGTAHGGGSNGALGGDADGPVRTSSWDDKARKPSGSMRASASAVRLVVCVYTLGCVACMRTRIIPRLLRV
jgi:hypothetical protein